MNLGSQCQNAMDQVVPPPKFICSSPNSQNDYICSKEIIKVKWGHKGGGPDRLSTSKRRNQRAHSPHPHPLHVWSWKYSSHLQARKRVPTILTLLDFDLVLTPEVWKENFCPSYPSIVFCYGSPSWLTQSLMMGEKERPLGPQGELKSSEEPHSREHTESH